MDNLPTARKDGFLKSACTFEASLVAIAIILGWIADIDPFASLSFSEPALLYGVLGTVPLILIFLALQQAPIKALKVIQQLLMDTLVNRLIGLHWTDLLILSAIAGIAEEILFRGVLQPWLEMAWGLQAGLWFSSIIFGLVHAITPVYAVLAALVSVYLGLSLDYGESRNLLTPIVIHGLYDFLAFLLIIQQYKKKHLPL
ncbi:MAG: CPBP family intramembrane metalloprotease [Methylococcaceae bacterium]|nr:CPBP family intramembrane metalloprotease [Methylococcaceae bacterium]